MPGSSKAVQTDEAGDWVGISMWRGRGSFSTCGGWVSERRIFKSETGIGRWAKVRFEEIVEMMANVETIWA